MSRRAPRPAPIAAAEIMPMRPAPAVALAAVLVMLALGAGLAVDWAQLRTPGRDFAGCRTAVQLAPRTFSGEPRMCIDVKSAYTASLETSRGRITLRLLADSAPRTVNNFVVLAENGYFDGLAVFRSEDWVVQTGDPQNSGRGGPGYSLPEEVAAQPLKWSTGAVGMARFPNDGISGSQFFIVRQPWPGGDPSIAYNRFGTVTSGQEVLGQLTAADRIRRVEVRRAPQ